MGFLLGLPLGLLSLLFALLRILIPAAVLILAALWLWRKFGGHRPSDPEDRGDEPHFKGPVYTVDYEEVKDDDNKKKRD